jgi:hypothetical protein
VRRARSPFISLQSFAELLAATVGPLPLEAGNAAVGARVAVSALDLDVPLEIRIDDGAELRVSLPRGRLATGFDPPHGRLAAHFDLVAPDNDRSAP